MAELKPTFLDPCVFAYLFPVAPGPHQHSALSGLQIVAILIGVQCPLIVALVGGSLVTRVNVALLICLCFVFKVFY